MKISLWLKNCIQIMNWQMSHKIYLVLNLETVAELNMCHVVFYAFYTLYVC